MSRELNALIGRANRQAYFISGVYLRCVVGAGFCVRGVSGEGLYTLRYVTGTLATARSHMEIAIHFPAAHCMV
jgi:hypothetical protein